jgi:F-type H+-transporting ATPase subunit b
MRFVGLLLCSLMTVLVLAAPSRIWADKEEPATKKNAAESTKEHDQAMHEESPDIFGKALDLAIWTLVVFIVLVFVLTKFAWKPMLAGLQQRERTIHTAQEEAKRDREEAQRLRDEVQKKLDATTAEVQAMLDKGRREAQQLQDEMMGKARADIQAERDRLHREIETARDQAVQELWNQTAQLATLVSAKAIRRQLSPDDHRRLVDEALAELGPAGKRRKESNV